MFPTTRNQWVEKLISFDTTSRNPNMEIIQFLKSYLDSLNVKTSLTYNDDKTKANLFATFSPASGASKGGIILSGHLDVVPVDGQKWDTDPFKATEVDGKIYGRGTCDMKGFIAQCMHMTPTFMKLAKNKPIYFAWTFDEEIGCLGGRVLTSYVRSNKIIADGCIIGEPTSNKVVIAHKGYYVWRVNVKGKACHSSMALTPNGCNAIDYSARLVVKIREIAESLSVGERDTLFDIPFTTLTTNVIHGGAALNIVPEKCEFMYEFRNLPTATKESIQEKIQNYVDKELLPSMKREYKDAEIKIESLMGVPELREANENDPFLSMIRTLEKGYKKRKVGFATEGGHYAGIGVPTIVCGPGAISVAHQPNEFVPCDELDKCGDFLLKAIKRNQEPVSNM